MADPNSNGAPWLQYARGDLGAAERMLNESFPEPRHACYLAQQAAEKALKAVLVYLGMDYPLSHNLNFIRDRIPIGWSLKATHPELGDLAAWAIVGRYPTDMREATIADAQTACAQARSVLESVAVDLKAHGFPT